MRLIDDGILRTLVPEPGCKIYSQLTNEYHDIVYLGKNDDGKTYTEVPDPNTSPEEQETMNTIINNSITYNFTQEKMFGDLINIANDLINK